jgi:hypothetical protein
VVGDRDASPQSCSSGTQPIAAAFIRDVLEPLGGYYDGWGTRIDG